ASALAQQPDTVVVAYDSKDTTPPTGVQKSEFAEVAKADVVLLCVPLIAYDQVLPALQPHLARGTLVVDVCSVKVEAEKRLHTGLSGHQNLLLTHPMFGPQS